MESVYCLVLISPPIIRTLLSGDCTLQMGQATIISAINREMTCGAESLFKMVRIQIRGYHKAKIRIH